MIIPTTDFSIPLTNLCLSCRREYLNSYQLLGLKRLLLINCGNFMVNMKVGDWLFILLKYYQKIVCYTCPHYILWYLLGTNIPEGKHSVLVFDSLCFCVYGLIFHNCFGFGFLSHVLCGKFKNLIFMNSWQSKIWFIDIDDAIWCFYIASLWIK